MTAGVRNISGVRGHFRSKRVFPGYGIFPGYEGISGVRGYFRGTRVFPGYEGIFVGWVGGSKEVFPSSSDVIGKKATPS